MIRRLKTQYLYFGADDKEGDMRLLGKRLERVKKYIVFTTVDLYLTVLTHGGGGV